MTDDDTATESSAAVDVLDYTQRQRIEAGKRAAALLAAANGPAPGTASMSV